jgi:hypothetical protein
MKLSNGAQYQIFGVRVAPESQKDISPGAEYQIRPINTSETYTWTVKPGLVLHAAPPQ